LKSRVNKTGGGVAIFIQDYLSFTIRTDFDDIMPDCIETAFVDISDGASCKFTVGVVLRKQRGMISDAPTVN